MGSPSGQDNRTGFEEEFYRALDRHGNSGTPEMWLFFKQVVDESDPGEQLQRVLAFRSELVKNKSLLFNKFENLAHWRELIQELLLRKLFELLSARSAVGQDVQSTSAEQRQVQRVSAGTEERSSTISPETQQAFESLGEVLSTAAKSIHSRRLLGPK